MYLYLFCIVFGLSLPTLLNYILSKLNNNDEVNDLYSQSDAITLNLISSQSSSSSSSSLWFNMGYWTTAECGFIEAAENLCQLVANAAGITQPESNDKDDGLGSMKVCEVGYGFGDSTLWFHKNRKLKGYVGWTFLESQCKVASRRIKETIESKDWDKFDLRVGDASTALEELEPESTDAVVAIDCAFHFPNRQRFFSLAHRSLLPHRRLALTDLLLPSTPLSTFDSILLRLICLLAKLPYKNLITPTEYRQSLIESGFEEDEIRMKDISTEVWKGFLKFIERKDEELGNGVMGSSWNGLKMYSKVVKWYSNDGGRGGGKERLKFYLISAEKKKMASSKKKVY